MVAFWQKQKPAPVGNRRVHMANERTFLAWIRTSIAIMAFGFVVEKFALFMKQMEFFLTKAVPGGDAFPPHVTPGYSSFFGILLVALGASMGALAFIRYKRVERQIEENIYHPAPILDVLLVISLVAIGVFLVIYLRHSM